MVTVSTGKNQMLKTYIQMFKNFKSMMAFMPFLKLFDNLGVKQRVYQTENSYRIFHPAHQQHCLGRPGHHCSSRF
jgi:hypothetical protein